MLKDLICEAARAAGIGEADARHAIGLILNTADRQASPLIERVFAEVPGAHTLSAATGQREGVAQGPIARLIEQTPGGRRHVTLTLFSRLHACGLGHGEISAIIAALGEFLERHFNASASTLICDLFASMDPVAEARSIAAA